MKKSFKVALLMLLVILFSGGCSTAKDELNGSYELSNGDSKMELEIDGDDALLMLYGESMEGTVERSKKTITFKDKKETAKFTYKLVGSKISLKSDEIGSFALEKVTNDDKPSSNLKKKKTSNSSKNEDSSNESMGNDSADKDKKNYAYEDFFYLETGEYEVGTDIKPGAYNVNLNFYDYSDDSKEDGSGYIEVTHGDSVKKYEFENSEVERRIILKDGDLINSVPENADSEFSFMSDDT
ncbi:hypothetical protein JZO77_19400 [Enterococcus hulanensis]|uniref:hypothetical protein n=1 Tax=Enterococcus hulanensis TaxID=2559929 RepID=UPI001A8DC4A6|nr:hypothetical protein [Enterococcus hulanensis]MBO0458904.1 hypothetical protein [Enterococcus hulanensis]